MIPNQKLIGAAVVAVRRALVNYEIAEQMYLTYHTEKYRVDMDKAKRDISRARDHLADVVLKACDGIPSVVLKDLK